MEDGKITVFPRSGYKNKSIIIFSVFQNTPAGITVLIRLIGIKRIQNFAYNVIAKQLSVYPKIFGKSKNANKCLSLVTFLRKNINFHTFSN